MNLDKYTELELTRLLRNLAEDQSEELVNQSDELIKQYNRLPSQFEFEDQTKEHKKHLDKHFDRMLDATQNYVRKIKVFYEDNTSAYDSVIHNNFYTFTIDKFIDYAYEVSKFLEDRTYELYSIGINQAKIDDFNSKLFDLRELNNTYLKKQQDYTATKSNIINEIKKIIINIQENL